MADELPPDRRAVLGGGERLVVPTLRPGGGGGPTHPQTFEDARRHLSKMLLDTGTELRSLPDHLRGPAVIFETTVLPNYLATSHTPQALLAEVGARLVGTRGARGFYETPTMAEDNAPTKSFFLLGDVAVTDRIAAIYERGEFGLSEALRTDMVKLESVSVPSGREILRTGREPMRVDGMAAMEAVLHRFVHADGTPDPEARAEVLRKWQVLVRQLGGRAEIDWEREHQGVTFVPTLLPFEQLEAAARFNPLRSLTPMPALVVEPTGPLKGIGGAVPLAPSTRPSGDERIALFDGGLPSSVPALSPYVTFTDLTGGAPEDAGSVQHATTVASAAAFGGIDPSAGLEVPPAFIDHFRVWPPPEDQRADLHLYWVLDRIKEQVETGRYRIVSLSIGPEFGIDPDEPPHHWTATLDELAARVGVVFCVAVGNTGEGDQESNEHVIGVPSDLINGLSVGSCDEPAPRPWVRAPYSSVGPGRPGARVAPQVVACGGHLPDKPFTCLVPGGQLAHSHGTSLATPVVARALAELRHALGPSVATPEALRAFAVHFAEAPDSLPPREVGYGRVPRHLVAELEAPPNEVTVLYADFLVRGRTVMLPMPLPEDLLAEIAGRYVTFRWTLAFTARTDSSDAPDYSQAGIEATFRPHAEVFNMNLKGKAPLRVNRLEEPSRYDYLIRHEGRTPSDRPLSRAKNEYAPENERRQERGKWETLMRIPDRMKASSLYRPAIDLHLLTRAGGSVTPADSGEGVRYAMLLTVQGPDGVAMHDTVRTAYPVLTPLVVRPPVTVPT